MEARAVAKYVRMSTRKARLVIDAIRGKNVNDALRIVQLSSKKPARPIRKTLESAIANAENNRRNSRLVEHPSRCDRIDAGAMLPGDAGKHLE